MDIDKLKSFCKLIELKTLPEVANVTGLSISGVQRQISTMEKELGYKLFEKKNKLLRPTRNAENFYRECLHIIRAYEKAVVNLGSETKPLEGELIINATQASVSTWMIDDMAEFIASHPEIQFRLRGDDAPVNHLLAYCDLFIREQQDELDKSIVQRFLRSFQFQLYASENYIKKNGTPKTINDLKDHTLIVQGLPNQKLHQELNWYIEFIPQHLQKMIFINSGHGVLRAIEDSLGIGIASNFAEINSKATLIKVLPQMKPKTIDIYLMYPQDTKKLEQINALYNYLIYSYQ